MPRDRSIQLLHVPVFHNWCNKGTTHICMCYLICESVHRKDPLLLPGNSPGLWWGGSRFPLSLSCGPYVWWPITVSKMCPIWQAGINICTFLTVSGLVTMSQRAMSAGIFTSIRDIQFVLISLFILIFYAYIILMFKHAVLGIDVCAVCLGQ